jgi:RNA polymerase sigma-70 factor (ECF subfamily)
MAPDDISDLHLFKRALAGEESAFAAFYRRWQGRVYRFSLRMSSSTSIAEDVTQEVFLALIHGRGRFDPGRGAFSSYVFGVARNQVLRRMTQERHLAPIIDDEDGGIPPAALRIDSDLLGGLMRRERMEFLYRAIATLPLRYREVIVLCELQELGYAEAACVIGCPEGTIRSRLHRARILLLEKLNQQESPDSRISGIEAVRCVS